MLQIKRVSKRFPGVLALDRVDFSLKQGEIHALMGENGAGKSTLMKIMSGVYSHDDGTMLLEGNEVRFQNAKAALAHGICIISQELSLCEEISVAENIFLGRMPKRKTGLVDWKAVYREGRKALLELGLDIDPHRLVKSLSMSQKQLVEIARAVGRKCKILLMDEPTSALTPTEIELLFNKMRELKGMGMSLVFISHKMDEIYEICDRMTLLRDGKLVATFATDDKTQNEVIEMMIGRSLDEYFEGGGAAAEVREPGEEIMLEVSNLNRTGKLKGINFSLRKGEVLGLYGLLGSGRTELLRALYGADKVASIDITISGKKLRRMTPSRAIRNGLSLVPEERKIQGLFLDLTVAENLSVANLDKVSSGRFLINTGRYNAFADGWIETLGIKTPSRNATIRNLSGGNQQKAIIARWLAKEPKVLLLDEPTKGIDVGAKSEIYGIIRKLAARGYSVLFVSSEMEEIEQLCDRVLLIRDGSLVGELRRGEIDVAHVSEALSLAK